MTIHTDFEDQAELCVTARDEEDTVIGVANAHVDGGAMVLTFIGVRQTCQRRGIGGELLDRLIAEARRLNLTRFIGKEVRSAASWRVLCRKLGDGKIVNGCRSNQLPDQPAQFLFAPSLGLLRVEGGPELTAEWNIG